MSKGAGATQRAIIDALRDPDRIWTTAELATYVYKTKHPRRAHKLAVKRAVKSAIARIRADRDKYAKLYAQAQRDTEAKLGPCPKRWSDAADKWHDALSAHPHKIAFNAVARRREPIAHMLAWRSTLRADGALVYHHERRPVRMWAVSIERAGPTFYEAAIEEITKYRVSTVTKVYAVRWIGSNSPGGAISGAGSCSLARVTGTSLPNSGSARAAKYAEFGYAERALQALLCPWSETNLIRAGDTESKPLLRARRVSLQLTEMMTE